MGLPSNPCGRCDECDSIDEGKYGPCARRTIGVTVAARSPGFAGMAIVRYVACRLARTRW